MTNLNTHAVAGGQPTDSKKLSEMEHKAFRACVGKLQWICPERPDIQYSVKECARALAEPTETDWTNMVRIVRYLDGTRNECLRCRIDNNHPELITAYSDSDWAKGVSRKSTSGGAILWQGTPILTLSRTQASVSLSTCEAEIMAA